MPDAMNLYLRDGHYYLRISRAEAPPNGQKVSLKKIVGYPVTDRAEAEQVMAALKRNWHKKKIIELDLGKQLSLAEFRGRYLKSRTDKSASTLRADDLALRLLGDAIGHSINVGAIRTQHLDKFKSTCIARGIRRVSLNSYLRHIRAAFGVAHEWGFMPRVPVAKNTKASQRRPRILSKVEIATVLLKASELDPEFLRVVIFALWTGCRRSEIRRLQWQDVRGSRVRVIGKGDKERFVPLLPAAAGALGPGRDVGPVFPQCHIDGYSHRFRAIADACGMADIRFHSLRHSAASYMIQSGVNPRAVQEILGHADFRTTQIYIHMEDDFVSAEIKKFTL
ncbi:MAG: site-specific integrase [Pseudomonadota bacterium]